MSRRTSTGDLLAWRLAMAEPAPFGGVLPFVIDWGSTVHPARNPDLPQLGETVWLVPGHCDPTVNLHERYVAVRGGIDAGVVEAVWAIEARGCVA